MTKEIPFNFRDHYRKKDVKSFMDNQESNKELKKHGVPITITALDILISLRGLPISERNFDGILADMVTLTPPGLSSIKKTINPDYPRKVLKIQLEYLMRKKIIRLSDKQISKTYLLTPKGKKIMERSRKVLNPTSNRI